MTRRTRFLLSSLLLLALLGVPVLLTWRAVRQERLDRALITAVKERKADAVVSSLKQGADPNACDQPKELPSFWQLLIDRWHRRPVAANDDAHLPALILAIGEYWEDYRMVRALVEYGADVNVRDQSGRTPLMYAAGHDCEPEGLSGIRIIDLLLRHRADLQAADKEGNSALLLATSSGNQDKVRLLLEREADVCAKNVSGENVLMLLVEESDPFSADERALLKQNIDLILNKGIDINAQDVAGDTALWYAVEDPLAVSMLLQRGADPNFKNKDGHTALQNAEQAHQPDIINLLKQAGAKG